MQEIKEVYELPASFKEIIDCYFKGKKQSW